ncbi:drug resistance abc transporter [Anaeramoeba flamelloides]|nr:drug resistance abc transporter [Anaeramoeba flamelloides]
MNLRGLYCKSIDHVEDRPKSEEDKQRDNTRFFQTYTHYIEENELTSDRIWCMDETPCQHSDTPKNHLNFAIQSHSVKHMGLTNEIHS